MKRRELLLFVTVLVCGQLTFAQSEEKPEPASVSKAVPEAKVSVTQHEVSIGGKVIRYTATAGTMLMVDDKSEPIALVGFTAYISDATDKAARPLMFAYNGGPGSASIWLHMGVLGPQRAVVIDAGFGDNGPFKRVANSHSILDEADLVMIDPVGTGFARPVGKGKGEDFWGVDQDIASVSKFIVKYVTKNGRWASPKYVLGESYGGMRTGGVSYYLLKNHMMALNGVILVSPFMEMVSGFSGLGIDLPHVLYLPAFAATAWYHRALESKPDDLRKFLDEVEAFALDDYARALMMGRRLSAADRQSVLKRLASYTGLSADYWEKANLRISEDRFNKELMRAKAITVGRIDSRFTGDMINRLGESTSYDPMTTAIGPGYLAAFMDYYRRDLKVEGAIDYKVFAPLWTKWDWKHKQPGVDGFTPPFPNTSVDLTYAMKQNPKMRVLVQQGYFDLATPYLTTEYCLDHMDLTPELRKNIRVAYYEAGHMMYVHKPSLVKFKKDLAEFVRGPQFAESSHSSR